MDSTQPDPEQIAKKFKSLSSPQPSDQIQDQTQSTNLLPTNDPTTTIVSLDPPIKDRCIICQNKSKYICPGCGMKTCCVACVDAHKQQYDCNGKLKDTVYVAKSSLNENTLLNDLKLLNKVEGVVKNGTPQSQQQQHYNKNHDNNNNPNDFKSHFKSTHLNSRVTQTTISGSKPTQTQTDIVQNQHDQQIEQYIKYCQTKFKFIIFSSLRGHSTYRSNHSTVMNITLLNPNFNTKNNKNNNQSNLPLDSTTTTISTTNTPPTIPTIPSPFKSCVLFTTSLIIPNIEYIQDPTTITNCIRQLSQSSTEYVISSPIPSFLPLYFLLYSLFSPLTFNFKTLKQQQTEFQSTPIINHNHIYCTTCTEYTTPNATPNPPQSHHQQQQHQRNPKKEFIKNNKHTNKMKSNRGDNNNNNNKMQSNDISNTSHTTPNSFDFDSNAITSATITDPINIDTTTNTISTNTMTLSPQQEESTIQPQQEQDSQQQVLPSQPSILSLHNTHLPLEIISMPSLLNTHLSFFQLFTQSPTHINPSASTLTHLNLPPFCKCFHQQQQQLSIVPPSTQMNDQQHEQQPIQHSNQMNDDASSHQPLSSPIHYYDNYHQQQSLFLLFKLLSAANNPKYIDCPLHLSISVCLSLLCNEFPTPSSQEQPQQPISTPTILDYPRFLVVNKEQRDILVQSGNLILVAGLQTTIIQQPPQQPSQKESEPINSITNYSNSMTNSTSESSLQPSQFNQTDSNYNKNHNQQYHNPFFITQNETDCAEIMLDNDIRLQSLRHSRYDPSRPTANLIPSGEIPNISSKTIDQIVQNLIRGESVIPNVNEIHNNGDINDDDLSSMSSFDEDDDEDDDMDFTDNNDVDDDDNNNYNISTTPSNQNGSNIHSNPIFDNDFMNLINKYRK